MKKQKTPQEQAAYEAQRAAQRRQWAIEHPELTRKYGRDFYKRNREKRIAYSAAYYWQHREERRAYNYAYYRRKKAENPNYVRECNARRRANLLASGWHPAPPRTPMSEEERKLARHNYYMANRLSFCRKKLGEYTDRSISTIREQIPDRVEAYFEAYPFEQFDRVIRYIILYRYGIRSQEAAFADCYEAGMLAYLYSIHRCAALGCDYTAFYIRKMVRIYVGCALVIWHETQEICKQNHLFELRLDEDMSGRLY